MYISRIAVNPLTADARRLSKLACRNRYREHQHLWRLFPHDPDSNRDFLFRQEQGNTELRYYVVSRRLPQDHDGTWRIATKGLCSKTSWRADSCL